MAEQTNQVTISGILLNEIMAYIQTSPTGQYTWKEVQNMLARIQQETQPVMATPDKKEAAPEGK